MGGYGSGRWGYHTKKTTVEACHKLTIFSLKPYLRPGLGGNLSWSKGGNNINFRTIGGDPLTAIRLIYTVTNRWTGEKTNLDYLVKLVTTWTPWGARRYWFNCPLIHNGRACGRRVGALYLPPSSDYFGCRHCHKLTYRTSQEHDHFGSVYARLAAAAGMDPQEVQNELECSMIRQAIWRGEKVTKRQRRRLAEFDRQAAARWAIENERRIAEIMASIPVPYADYLTAGELCERSGLDPADLDRLGAARLLVPDHEGKYRPKLAGWAVKLAYLLEAGWSLAEIKAWAGGRWSTPNPRAWPPDRQAWQLVDPRGGPVGKG